MKILKILRNFRTIDISTIYKAYKSVQEIKN